MSKKRTEDILGKAVGLDGDASVEDALSKAQDIVDQFRQSITDIRRSNDQLRREIADAEARISKIEERDKAAGHVPHRWRAAITHDAPELMQ
jgi:phage shock protein A